MDKLWSCTSRHIEPEDETGNPKANNNWKLAGDNKLSRDNELNSHSNASSNSNSDNWKTGSGNTTSSSSGGGGGGGVLRYATSCIRFANPSEVTDKSLPAASASRTSGSTTSSSRRQRFPLAPLAILPCTVRQADPSPPPAEGDVDQGPESGRSSTIGKGGHSASLPSSSSTVGPVDSSGQWSTIDGCLVESVNERYSVIGLLGKGTFGRILLAECRLTGRKTALKVGNMFSLIAT